MKHSLIISVLFSSFHLFAQDSSAVYSHKLNQLRSELGVSAETDFDHSVFGRLVNRLESLGIEDEQLEDGYEWGGGKIGFEAYLKNNIDRLLSDFKLAPIPSDSLNKVKIELPADKPVEVQKVLIAIEQEIEPVKDLVLVKKSTKKDKKRKKKKGCGTRRCRSRSRSPRTGSSMRASGPSSQPPQLPGHLDRIEGRRNSASYT